MKTQWLNTLFAGICLTAVGCGGGVKEIPPVTEPGENESEAEMQKRMEESKKMGSKYGGK